MLKSIMNKNQFEMSGGEALIYGTVATGVYAVCTVFTYGILRFGWDAVDKLKDWTDEHEFIVRKKDDEF